MYENEKHEQAYIHVDEIVPNDWNANEEDEQTFDCLVEGITETGFIDSMTVVPLEDGRYRIIGGEHRWRAAKAAGESEIPCLVLRGAKWKDTDLQKFVTVRMNMLRGKLHPEKFLKLYNEMANKYGEQQLQKLFGFTDKRAFNKIIKGVTSAAKQALPKELHAEMEEKARDAKTVEDLSTIVQEMFQKYGDTADKSFMIFTHGKREHIYVCMSSKLRRIMDKALVYCDATGTDINDVIAPILEKGVMERAAQWEAKIEKTEELSRISSDPF